MKIEYLYCYECDKITKHINGFCQECTDKKASYLKIFIAYIAISLIVLGIIIFS